jgi:phosphatidylglycerol:prolipoprotein diacylglycerol transferase
MAAPSTALGYAIARVGCFLRGCCYGAPTSLPWGHRFLLDPSADPSHAAPGVLTAPSHPTQLYAAAASLIIFGLLLWLRGRLPARGQLFLAYLAMYSVARWAIEILRRGYSAQPVAPGSWLTQAQVASMVIFAIAVAGIWVLARREARTAGHESKQVHSQTGRSQGRRASG